MTWNQAESQLQHELRMAKLQQVRGQERRQAEEQACQAAQAQAWAQVSEQEVLQL